MSTYIGLSMYHKPNMDPFAPGMVVFPWGCIPEFGGSSWKSSWGHVMRYRYLAVPFSGNPMKLWILDATKVACLILTLRELWESQ